MACGHCGMGMGSPVDRRTPAQQTVRTLDHVELTEEEKVLFDQIQSRGLMPTHEEVAESINANYFRPDQQNAYDPRIPNEDIKLDAYKLIKLVMGQAYIGRFTVFSIGGVNRFTASPLFNNVESAGNYHGEILSLLINAEDGLLTGVGNLIKAPDKDPILIFGAKYIFGKQGEEATLEAIRSGKDFSGDLRRNGDLIGSFWMRELSRSPVSQVYTGDASKWYQDSLSALKKRV